MKRIATLESHRETPHWCETTLARFGQNPHGENLYRLIWGWNRLTPVAEQIDFRELAKHPEKIGTMRLVPKYFLNLDGELNRWVLEKWMPPESFGTPEQWKSQTWDSILMTYTLGPYPSKGEYEFCHAMQTERGNPVDITPHLVALIVSTIEYGKNHFSFYERKIAIQEEMARADKLHDDKVAAIFKEAIEDVDRHIAMNPSALDDVKLDQAIIRPQTGIRQGRPNLRLRRVN